MRVVLSQWLKIIQKVSFYNISNLFENPIRGTILANFYGPSNRIEKFRDKKKWYKTLFDNLQPLWLWVRPECL